jgi:hypothetical protein
VPTHTSTTPTWGVGVRYVGLKPTKRLGTGSGRALCSMVHPSARHGRDGLPISKREPGRAKAGIVPVKASAHAGLGVPSCERHFSPAQSAYFTVGMVHGYAHIWPISLPLFALKHVQAAPLKCAWHPITEALSVISSYESGYVCSMAHTQRNYSSRLSSVANGTGSFFSKNYWSEQRRFIEFASLHVLESAREKD